MGSEETRGPTRSSFASRLLAVDRGELFFFSLLLTASLIFLTASIAMFFGVASTATEVKEDLASLPYAVGQPPGTRAVLTGTIAEDTKPLHDPFVVYLEEVYHGPSKYRNNHWEVTDGKTQTFRVDTPSGSMQLDNPNYDLYPRVADTGEPLITDWDHVETRIKEPPGTFEGAKRYRGLVPGGPVTALGTVTADGTFDAEFVVGANLDDLQKLLEPVASGETSILAYVLSAIGLIGVVLVLVLFVRTHLRSDPADVDG